MEGFLEKPQRVCKTRISVSICCDSLAVPGAAATLLPQMRRFQLCLNPDWHCIVPVDRCISTYDAQHEISLLPSLLSLGLILPAQKPGGNEVSEPPLPFQYA